MTEYTPTTEEVRKAWNMMPHDRYYKGNLVGQLASGEEFHRWLAEVKAQAWEEGERRGRDNERALMMCQAQLRPSNSAVLIKNPYRPQHE